MLIDTSLAFDVVQFLDSHAQRIRELREIGADSLLVPVPDRRLREENRQLANEQLHFVANIYIDVTSHYLLDVLLLLSSQVRLDAVVKRFQLLGSRNAFLCSILGTRRPSPASLGRSSLFIVHLDTLQCIW